MNDFNGLLEYEANDDLMRSEFFDAIRFVESITNTNEDLSIITNRSNETNDNSIGNQSTSPPYEHQHSSTTVNGNTTETKTNSDASLMSSERLVPLSQIPRMNWPITINTTTHGKIIIQTKRNVCTAKPVTLKPQTVYELARPSTIGSSSTVLSNVINSKPVNSLTSFAIRNTCTNNRHIDMLCKQTYHACKLKNINANDARSIKREKLNLTFEEQLLLSKEGIQLPTHYPLTKSQDQDLKRIRRKIRNKISAQCSRKRKKDYVADLEQRMRRSDEENRHLTIRVRDLQHKNRSLMSYVEQLQTMLFQTTSINNGNTGTSQPTISNKAATPSARLLIMLISITLLLLSRQYPSNEANSISDSILSPETTTITSDEGSMSANSTTGDEFLSAGNALHKEFERRSLLSANNNDIHGLHEDDLEMPLGADIESTINQDSATTLTYELVKLVKNVQAKYGDIENMKDVLSVLMQNVHHYINESNLEKSALSYVDNMALPGPDIEASVNENNLLSTVLCLLRTHCIS